MEVLPTREKRASPHMVDSIATYTADAFSFVSTAVALYDSCLLITPMVANIAISHLLANSLRVLPTLTMHSTFCELWATFQLMEA